MPIRRKIAAGNWKMNGLKAALPEFRAIAAARTGAEVIICPPATLLATFSAENTGVTLGGQDCRAEAAGAYTGDLSAAMLADAGARAVILGHSERRAGHGETDALVRAKAEAAWAAGLTAIICLGETLAERDAGRALAVAGGQLEGSVPDGATAANTVIAYEPVWAIGTGRTAAQEEIAEMHGHLRSGLLRRFGADGGAFRILYGGSVKAANAAEIFGLPDVDGGLVGGASLKAADFLPIIAALG